MIRNSLKYGHCCQFFVSEKTAKTRKIALSRMKLIKAIKKVKKVLVTKIFSVFLIGINRKEFGKCIEDVDEFLTIITAIHFSLNSDQQKDLESNFRLMKKFNNRRWPNAIQFNFCWVMLMNKMGNVEEGTKLIHSTLEMICSGQVANRTWKENNVYKELWIDPAALSIDVFKIQIPLKVGKKSETGSYD